MKHTWLLIVLLLLIVTNILMADGTEENFGLVMDEQTRIALDLTLAAQAELYDVEYQWNTLELAHCSGFASRYVSLAGMPVALDDGGPASYEAELGSPIPAANTLKQVTRFRLLDSEVGGGYTMELPVADLLYNQTDWSDFGILPGSLIYFQVAESHNGYNSYHHVAILMGYNENGEPVLADFAPRMAHGPILGRTVNQVVAWLYYSVELEGWDLSVAATMNRPDYLSAFVVDTLGISQAAVEANVWQ